MSRTRERTASIPSASPPMYQRWPPVTVSGGPDTRTRGPSTKPSARPSFSANPLRFQEPQSHMVVTPEAKAAAVFWAERSRRTSSLSSSLTCSPVRPSPGMLVWVWMSNIPASRVAPEKSNVSRWAPPESKLSASDAGPTHLMALPWTATAIPSCAWPATPSISLPGMITLRVLLS